MSTFMSKGTRRKIFCISMQRNGTSSVGDFLEQWNLKRIGSPTSNRNRWPLRWLDGDFEAIFKHPDFIAADIFEDDPWWFPEFYKVLYHRFPGSRFILLERDSDSWFRSLVRHSNGFSPGNTELHAKLYRREDEQQWLKSNIRGYGTQRSQEMVIYDKAQLYMSVYERHNREVLEFFDRHEPGALFHKSLNDSSLWQGLAEWLKLPEREDLDFGVHTHKAKGEFTQSNLLQRRPKGADASK